MRNPATAATGESGRGQRQRVGGATSISLRFIAPGPKRRGQKVPSEHALGYFCSCQYGLRTHTEESQFSFRLIHCRPGPPRNAGLQPSPVARAGDAGMGWARVINLKAPRARSLIHCRPAPPQKRWAAAHLPPPPHACSAFYSIRGACIPHTRIHCLSAMVQLPG